MKRSKNELKAKFATGSKPVQDDFGDWIDSFVHLNDQQAVDAQIVSLLITAYDQSLKTRNQDGSVNTLGDVFAMFAGIDDSTNLASLFAKIDWTKLPGKPVSLDLTWTDQTVATNNTTYNPLGTAGTAGAGPATRWLLADVSNVTNGILRDIRTERHWIVSGAGGESGFYLDQIVGVKYMISPKVNLS